MWRLLVSYASTQFLADKLSDCSRSYLENQMAVALGGRIAEELIFGEDNVTTGASNDFMQVCSAY